MKRLVCAVLVLSCLGLTTIVDLEQTGDKPKVKISFKWV